MRHQVDHRKLGRMTSHRKALLRSLATALVLAGRIETTLPKAKELRRVADRLVTWGKEGTLHARRRAARILYDPQAVQKLFSEYAIRFQARHGGYTRILRLGLRRGDAAPMAMIEYLGYELPKLVSPEERKKEAKHKKEEAKAAKKETPKAEKKREAGAESKKKEKETRPAKETKPAKEAKPAKAVKSEGAKPEPAEKPKKEKRGLFGRRKK